LETLCGSKSSELKVKDMSSYSFAPKTIVRQISSVLTCGWRQDKTTAFVKCIAEYPEYSGATLSKCRDILSTESTELAQTFGSLLQQVWNAKHTVHFVIEVLFNTCIGTISSNNGYYCACQ